MCCGWFIYYSWTKFLILTPSEILLWGVDIKSFCLRFHVQAPFAFLGPKSGTYVVQFRYGALFFVECRWPQAVLMAYISSSPMEEMWHTSLLYVYQHEHYGHGQKIPCHNLVFYIVVVDHFRARLSRIGVIQEKNPSFASSLLNNNHCSWPCVLPQRWCCEIHLISASLIITLLFFWFSNCPNKPLQIAMK